jgi:hypothetical protein
MEALMRTIRFALKLHALGAIARDIHTQFQLLGCAINFNVHCDEDDDDDGEGDGYSWRMDALVKGKYSSAVINSANPLVTKANVKSNFVDNCTC